MKSLVTGSTGFIGSRLAAHCRASGDEVVALGQCNSPLERARAEHLKSQGIAVHEIPMTDRAALTSQMAGCDVVYHLAAAQHEANVPDQYFYDVNVTGTQNMLDASVHAGVGRFVHGSTIGVYGSALDGEISEDTPTRPDNIYGQTKLAGETVALEYVERLPVAVARISETYGPGDGRLLKLFKAIKKRAFFMIGNGRNLHQLIYVDDLIEGLISAARQPAAVGNVFVLAGSERLTTADMCADVARAVDVSLRGFRSPMWPFMAAAIVMESTLVPLGIQPPLHRRRLDFFRKSFFFDRNKAQQMLAFEPSTAFADGAVKTAQWYVENGYL